VIGCLLANLLHLLGEVRFLQRLPSQLAGPYQY
jgi:hypothetical protein